MQYGFGADMPQVAVRTALDRTDLFYLISLAKSIDVDLNALVSGGQSSMGAWKLLNDKTTLWNAAWERFLALQGNALLEANQAQAAELANLHSKIGEKKKLVDSWTPTQTPATLPAIPYRVGVPFTTAPVAMPTSPLAPTADVLSKLSTTPVGLLTDYELSMKMARGYRPPQGAAGGGAGGLPIPLLIGAAAVAAFLTFR